MKKIYYITIPLIFVNFLLPTVFIYALDYVKLEPNAFPGVTASSDLTTFLSQVFSFGIAIAVALALIMIIFGGIQYMTTDSWSKKDEGKERIKNALWGLGMALVSWLLLYTINPALVDFKNNTLLNTKKTNTTTNQSYEVNTSSFSDLYDSKTNTLTTPGSQAASHQTIINSSPISPIVPGNSATELLNPYGY